VTIAGRRGSAAEVLREVLGGWEGGKHQKHQLISGLSCGIHGV
jgi:hypothetical protein